MATANRTLAPAAAKFDTSEWPQYLIQSSTDYSGDGLAFDDTTAETAYWKFLAIDYSSTPSIDIFWTADTATSGGVRWSVQLMAVTPDTDSTAIPSASFDTAQAVTDTALATTAGRVMKATIAITNVDSIAAGDVVFIKFQRLPAHAGDTMSGDAILQSIELSYTTT